MRQFWLQVFESGLEITISLRPSGDIPLDHKVHSIILWRQNSMMLFKYGPPKNVILQCFFSRYFVLSVGSEWRWVYSIFHYTHALQYAPSLSSPRFAHSPVPISHASPTTNSKTCFGLIFMSSFTKLCQLVFVKLMLVFRSCQTDYYSCSAEGPPVSSEP
jgi:hypothetical protein